ncbi:thioredoxin family protein [Acidobacteriota bacterium]
MKNSFRATIVIIMMISVNLFSLEKQIKIGECRWHTGQNDFGVILEIAKKNMKPILAFYSASWCGSCQRIIKDILKAKEFRTIEKEAILLFIEFTEKGGKKYIDKYKVRKFPTLKLFSPEGDEWATDIPGETVRSIYQWVRQVKEKQKLVVRLEKKPTDWESLFKATERTNKTPYSSDQYIPIINLLRNALEAAGDSGGTNRQRAYERLADYLYVTMTNKLGPRSRSYAGKYKEEFTRIIRSYYPDRFRYELKDRRALVMWINWLTTAGDYKAAVRVFENALRRKEKKPDPGKNIELLEGIIKSYLSLGREKEALIWFNEIESSFNNDIKKQDFTSPPLTYLKVLREIIDYESDKGNHSAQKKYVGKLHQVLAVTAERVDGKTLYKSFPDLESCIDLFHRKGMKKELKKIAVTFQQIINSFEDESCEKFITIRMAKKYGVFVDRALEMLTDSKLSMYPGINTYILINKAVLLSKKGERKKSHQFIIQRYKKIQSSRDLSNLARSKALNSLAWATFEMGAVDQTSLQMAKESVRLDKNCHNLDTLATIYAEFGNFREAVKTGREALSLAIRESDQVMIEEKLAHWQQNIE